VIVVQTLAKTLWSVLIAANVLGLAGNAAATEFPTRPLTLIVGVGAGSSIDIAARFYADALGRVVQQRVVVENRTGGGGLIALQTVTSAPPDGHTLGVALSALFNTMPWVQKMPFDPVEAVEPITLAFRFPIYMAVPAATKATNAREFFEEARKSGKELNYGSGGQNSTAHLLGLLLSKETGLPMQHIPYTAPSQYLADLAQGRTDFQFMPYSTAKPLLDAGNLKFLAVSSPERTHSFPGIPTLRELGYGGAELTSWYGIVAPKGTPGEIVMKLAALFQDASRNQDLVRKMDLEGTEVITNSPAEFAAFIRTDKEKHGKILAQLGLIEPQ
jgi:tripartite-type tricarboxylate transporter receptor subunit TctC